MKISQTIITAALALTFAASSIHFADADSTAAPAASITVTTSSSSQMPDVLRGLSKELGSPVVVDPSVVATVGQMSITKNSLSDMVQFLQSMEPGLQWQEFYVPKDSATPTSDLLYGQLQALKTITYSGIEIVDPTAKTTITVKKDALTNDSVTPDGMSKVYFFYDDAMRAQLAKSGGAAAQTADGKTQQFTNSLDTMISQFTQLSPQQQQMALPQLMNAARQFYQSLSPAALQGFEQTIRNSGQQNTPGQ